MKKRIWILPLVGSGAAVWLVLGALRASTGTPSEAARLAIALCCAVLPYVAARTLSELLARRSGSHTPPAAPLSRNAGLLAAATSLLFAAVATASYTTWSAEAIESGRWYAMPATEVGGKPMVSALVISDSELGDGSGRSYRPILVVSCALGDTSVTLGNEARIESKFGSTSVGMRIRLDDGPPEIMTGLTAGAGRSLSMNDAIPLVKRMLEHRKLAVQFELDGAGPQTAVFDLAGLRDHIAEIQTACAWE